jgi:hypothetical protein
MYLLSATIVTGVLAAASFGVGLDAAVAANGPSEPSPPAIREHCKALLPPPTSPQADVATNSANDGTRTITATLGVPAVAVFVLAPNGVPFAARTNTDAAPACSDYFWVFDGPTDTVGHLATLAQVNELMSMDLSGIWAPGVWHPLTS